MGKNIYLGIHVKGILSCFIAGMVCTQEIKRKKLNGFHIPTPIFSLYEMEFVYY